MDPVCFAIHRAAGTLSPALRADLQWRRSRAANDFAMRVVDALVRPGEVVVDVGAAWGLYACRLARSVGRQGKVHAFEPNPTYQRPLQRLARRFPQLQVHSVALSSQAGDATLHVPHIADRMVDEMATLVPPRRRDWEVGTRARVTVRRLDDVVEAEKGPVAFVKCDVEGHELEVMDGGKEVLSSRPTILMEIEQRHHDEPISQVFARLEQLGYRLFAVRPEGLSPLGDFDVETDQTAHFRRKADPCSGEPAEYVKDFLLMAEGKRPPGRLLASRAPGRGPTGQA
jgi:FkbM family methyltransferase